MFLIYINKCKQYKIKEKREFLRDHKMKSKNLRKIYSKFFNKL